MINHDGATGLEFPKSFRILIQEVCIGLINE